jgi:predicted choloylglycine hydrolase
VNAPAAPIPFRCLREDRPGAAWAALFAEAWPAYERWFLLEGDAARPARSEAEDALARHMPELLPTYRELLALAGDSDLVARFLAHYRPTPYMAGCSQVVSGAAEPFLIRNYDYHPELWEAALVHSAWSKTRVIAMSECLWGVLDGMNEHGLAVSLAFGGRRVVGDGFGIPLVLRYVLEFCRTTRAATEALARIPSHMAYNVSVVDALGTYATVQVAPDRPAAVLRSGVATNHQGHVEWPAHASLTATTERERFLAARLADPEESRERLARRFLERPLYSRDYERAFGTLYTALYLPARGELELTWPGRTLARSFADFAPQEFSLAFGPAAESG